MVISLEEFDITLILNIVRTNKLVKIVNLRKMLSPEVLKQDICLFIVALNCTRSTTPPSYKHKMSSDCGLTELPWFKP